MKRKIISMLLVLTIGLSAIIPASGLDVTDMSADSNLMIRSWSIDADEEMFIGDIDYVD